MSYVITQACAPVKDKGCLGVCPVNAIAEGARMLYIDPESCICCAACVSVCPADAIYFVTEVPAAWRDNIRENAEFFGRRSDRWPT